MDEVAARQVIANHLAIPVARVHDQARFRDLGADSLDLVTLTIELEEAFDLRIPEDAVEDCTTIGDALGLLHAVFVSSRRDLEILG